MINVVNVREVLPGVSYVGDDLEVCEEEFMRWLRDDARPMTKDERVATAAALEASLGVRQWVYFYNSTYDVGHSVYLLGR